MQCCRYSAVTLYGKCNGISHAECFVLSHQYLLHYVCNAQYGCCLHSLILWFPSMLLRYCLSDFETVPVAPIVLVSLMILHSTSTVFLLSYLYTFRIFSTSFYITFLFPDNVTSIRMHVPFALPWIMTSGFFLGMVLSGFPC